MADPEEELRRLANEQSALRHVATLVAAGATESEIVNAVNAEIARLFEADASNTLR